MNFDNCNGGIRFFFVVYCKICPGNTQGKWVCSKVRQPDNIMGLTEVKKHINTKLHQTRLIEVRSAFSERMENECDRLEPGNIDELQPIIDDYVNKIKDLEYDMDMSRKWDIASETESEEESEYESDWTSEEEGK